MELERTTVGHRTIEGCAGAGHAGAEVETHQGEDGSFEVVVNALEGRMADRMLQGRGSIGMASTARAAGKHLRG